MPDLERRKALEKAATTFTPESGLPLLAMCVFADWLDENGEPDLAYAYRWCGKRGVFPRPSPQGRRWSWVRIPQRARKFHRLHWELPHQLYDAIGDGWYRKPSHAIEYLSRALAELLLVVRHP